MRKKIVKALIAILCVFAIVKSCGYIQATLLCQRIRSGEDISTSFSNGTTAPVIFDRAAAVLQSEGVQIPLVVACYYRNVQAVETLLENGADPNYFLEGRMSPLEAALWNGPAGLIDEDSLTIVKRLVEAGCDVNLHASDASIIETLSACVGSGEDAVREEIFLYLLDHGADREHNGYEYIFHNVIRFGNVGLVRTMVEEYGFDINGVGYMGQTPLILAVYYSRYNSGVSATAEMIDVLLKMGADRNMADDEGKTAYDYAVEYGYTDIAQLLIPEN